MSEIGSGSGSSYPSALDVNNVPEVNSPAAGKTKARKEVVEDLSACVLAIEGELGTDPSGTKTDVKTFLQTEHNADGTHKTLSADTTGNANTATLATLATTATTATKITDGSNFINTKIINIGDWNMDSISSVAVAHGLTLSKIRAVSAYIIKDDSLYVSDLYYQNASVHTEAHGIYCDGTNITLARFVGSPFDSSDYDSTSFNRGWLTITYVD